MPKLYCKHCKNVGRVYWRWVDADLREHLGSKPCPACRRPVQFDGMLELCGKDKASGERDDKD